MTIRELLNFAIKKIKSTSPQLDAEVLLAFVLEKPREYLFTDYGLQITDYQKKKFLSLINKRKKGWPVAYLTHHKEFFGLDFYVDRNVLIPRPETEGLVELSLAAIKDLELRIKRKKISILDIGTGSGCIAISLAVAETFRFPFYGGLKTSATRNQYFASDISAEALRMARKNARAHKVKISFKRGDLLHPWKNQPLDIIIANLPYGWKAWKNNTTTETIGLEFEPAQALFTSEQGLSLIKRLLAQIAQRSDLPRYIFLEFDPRQKPLIKKLAKKLLPAYEIKIARDLAGRARYARLAKKSSSIFPGRRGHAPSRGVQPVKKNQ